MDELSNILQQIDDENKERISDILSKRKQAILRYDYSEAENLEFQLKEIKISQNELKKQQIIDCFEPEIQKITDRSKKSVISMKIQNRINEEKIRESISKHYHEMQARHKSEMSCFESEYKKQREIEAKRPVPESFELLEQSQKEAFNSNYAKARELKDESVEVRRREIEKRIKAVDEKYEEGMKKIMNKCKSEIEKLTVKLTQQIEANRALLEEQIKEEEKQRKPRYINLLQSFSMILSKECNNLDISSVQQDLREMLERKLESIGEPIPVFPDSFPQKKSSNERLNQVEKN